MAFKGRQKRPGVFGLRTERFEVQSWGFCCSQWPLSLNLEGPPRLIPGCRGWVCTAWRFGRAPLGPNIERDRDRDRLVDHSDNALHLDLLSYIHCSRMLKLLRPDSILINCARGACASFSLVLHASKLGAFAALAVLAWLARKIRCHTTPTSAP